MYIKTPDVSGGVLEHLTCSALLNQVDSAEREQGVGHSKTVWDLLAPVLQIGFAKALCRQRISTCHQRMAHGFAALDSSYHDVMQH